MTSAELRRIVGAMSGPKSWIAGDVGVYEDPDGDGDRDVAYARGPMLDRSTFAGNVLRWKEQARRDSIAAASLANHADALVRLAEACERVAAYELQGMQAIGDGARGAVLAMRDALLAVHATKVAP